MIADFGLEDALKVNLIVLQFQKVANCSSLKRGVEGRSCTLRQRLPTFTMKGLKIGKWAEGQARPAFPQSPKVKR
jgi:hypothetical protein